MAKMFQLWFIFTISVVSGNYTFWSPDGVKYLYCPMEHCIDSSVHDIGVNQCCACLAKPLWEIQNNLNYNLSTEILDPNADRTRVFNTTDFSPQETVFSFTFIDGKLKTLPENLCHYNVVTIDVTNNRFKEIGNLSCFRYLDTLILKSNLISFVSNNTFRDMIYLRRVDLSYNQINKMDLNVVSTNGILQFNFESNQLRQIDVANIFASNKTFCGVSYAQNKHSVEITNALDFQLGENTVVCNDADFSGFSAKPLAIVSVTRNLPDAREFVRHAPCGVHVYNGSGIDCGCELSVFYPIVFPKAAALYFKNEYGYFCNSPDELINMNARQVYENETLREKMTCDIENYCHSRPDCKCKCTAQPIENRLLVDCSEQSCTSLPEVLPESRYAIWLKVNINQIRNVDFKSYSSRIEVLDLSDNSVEQLNENLDYMKAPSKILLTNHSLQTLPKSIQYFHPDVFRFGNKGIPCNCENRWIGEWRRFKKASNLYPLYCSNYPYILIEDIIDILNDECKESEGFTWWHLAFLLPFFILTTLFLLYIHFRYDFLLFKRRYFKKSKEKDNQKKWKFDVYISFNDDEEELRHFVFKILDPFLRGIEIKTYIPCRDQLGGHGIEETVSKQLQESKNLLIIHSSGIYENFVRQVEFKLGWLYYMKTDLHKILVLNFDNCKITFQTRILSALNRCNMVLKVTDRKQSLKEKLKNTFDSPLGNQENRLKPKCKKRAWLQ